MNPRPTGKTGFVPMKRDRHPDRFHVRSVSDNTASSRIDFWFSQLSEALFHDLRTAKNGVARAVAREGVAGSP